MNITSSRVWVEINIEQLCKNFRAIAAHVWPLKVTAVLKANAYGLGVQKIAETLSNAGAEGFAVAELREAMQLVYLNKPIQILGAILPQEVECAVANGFIIPLGEITIARMVSDEAKKKNKIAKVQLAVDTAMGRVGVLFSEAKPFIESLLKLPNIKIVGIYSHFPIAYQSALELSSKQVERIKEIVEFSKDHGIEFERIHIANSDAINNLPFTIQAPFTHVRAGINLHGSFDPEGKRSLSLDSILTLKTRLVAIRTLPENYTIGYGCTYKLCKPTRVGTVSAGYADGLPLALSNRGYVLIRGIPCPIIGRISMDYTTVDLSMLKDDIEIGEEVICLGGIGIHAISVEYWAGLKNTHAYDIICSLGNRVERVFMDAHSIKDI